LFEYFVIGCALNFVGMVSSALVAVLAALVGGAFCAFVPLRQRVEAVDNTTLCEYNGTDYSVLATGSYDRFGYEVDGAYIYQFNVCRDTAYLPYPCTERIQSFQLDSSSRCLNEISTKWNATWTTLPGYGVAVTYDTPGRICAGGIAAIFTIKLRCDPLALPSPPEFMTFIAEEVGTCHYEVVMLTTLSCDTIGVPVPDNAVGGAD
jgi:hypothetical protein